MQVVTDYFLKGCATNLKGTALDGVLKGAKVGLFVNTPSLSQGTVIGDLTEPTFAGYAQQAVTWSGPFQQPDLSWADQGGLYTFQATDDLTPTVVTGVFLVDSAGTHLIAAELLAPPIALPSSAQALLVSPQIASGNATWGANAIVT